MLVSIYSKSCKEMTNINFVFPQVPPCEQERGGESSKWKKLKLVLSTIFVSIPTVQFKNKYYKPKRRTEAVLQTFWSSFAYLF